MTTTKTSQHHHTLSTRNCRQQSMAQQGEKLRDDESDHAELTGTHLIFCVLLEKTN